MIISRPDIPARPIGQNATPLGLRSHLQLRLASLLLMMIPLGLGCLWLRNYLETRSVPIGIYSRAELDRNLRAGRVVLVSFSAEWSLTTMMHEYLVHNSPSVNRWLRRHDAVFMRADLTHGGIEARAALDSLHQNSIPVIVIYSASSVRPPIVLEGPFTEIRVLAALENAK